MVALPQTYFGRYDPWNWGWEQGDLVPLEYNGVPFVGGVHPLAKPIFIAILDRLVPLLPNGLKHPGCWGWSPTSVTVGGSPSFHNFGLAIDINAPDNGMRLDGSPGPHEIPDAAGDIAREHGGEWGGWWTQPKDYMHIELHLSPAGAIYVAQQLPAAGQEEDMPVSPQEIEQIAMRSRDHIVRGDVPWGLDHLRDVIEKQNALLVQMNQRIAALEAKGGA